jgi:hypothetical protein
MIRILVRSVDEGGAINVGSPVDVQYKTFDIDAQEIEAYLTEFSGYQNHYVIRSVVGVEIIKKGDFYDSTT